ncbi:unnamed protein product [Gordionus sp. m RMFG-2023]
MQEFFRQGDQELEMGLPFSPLCDKTTTLVPESQIGFINYIVDPCFQVLEAMLESILDYKDKCKTIKEKEDSSKHHGASTSMEVEKDRSSSMNNIVIRNPKKLKHTPWNQHISKNLENWKDIVSNPAKEKTL